MDRYLLELNPETRDRLERLKAYPVEPLDHVINRLIDSYEDEPSLTKEEIEGIREILRGMKEGRFLPGGDVGEQPVPDTEQPPSSIGDPQVVKDMEALFSGTAQRVQDDPDLARYHSIDSTDIREIDPYDKRGRARTHHLDNL
jgi:hypothetical protein